MKRDIISGHEAIQKWQEHNNVYHFEMNTRNLEKLVATLGYESVEDFLSDNPGAQQAVVEFISDWADRIPEWKESLLNDISDDDDDDDVDDVDYDDDDLT